MRVAFGTSAVPPALILICVVECLTLSATVAIPPASRREETSSLQGSPRWDAVAVSCAPHRCFDPGYLNLESGIWTVAILGARIGWLVEGVWEAAPGGGWPLGTWER